MNLSIFPCQETGINFESVKLVVVSSSPSFSLSTSLHLFSSINSAKLTVFYHYWTLHLRVKKLDLNFSKLISRVIQDQIALLLLLQGYPSSESYLHLSLRIHWNENRWKTFHRMLSLLFLRWPSYPQGLFYCRISISVYSQGPSLWHLWSTLGPIQATQAKSHHIQLEHRTLLKSMCE